MLTPVTPRPGEAYATFEEIELATDLPEADVRVPFWRRRGQPVLVRMRGMDFDTQQRIERESLGKDGKRDFRLFTLLTLQATFVRPTLSRAQALALGKKHPHAVVQLAEFGQLLHTLSAEELAAWVAELAGLRDAVSADSGADAQPGSDDPVLAPDAGDPLRAPNH